MSRSRQIPAVQGHGKGSSAYLVTGGETLAHGVGVSRELRRPSDLLVLRSSIGLPPHGLAIRGEQAGVADVRSRLKVLLRIVGLPNNM